MTQPQNAIEWAFLLINTTTGLQFTLPGDGEVFQRKLAAAIDAAVAAEREACIKIALDFDSPDVENKNTPFWIFNNVADAIRARGEK
jgi:hypothetical protein